MPFVRGTDDVKIAQRFIAGFDRAMHYQSARNLSFIVRFTDSFGNVDLNPVPSCRGWAILISSAPRTRPIPTFWRPNALRSLSGHLLKFDDNELSPLHRRETDKNVDDPSVDIILRRSFVNLTNN